MRNTLILFACALASFFPSKGSAQDLVINEVMPANLGEALDPSYNFGGWIELYNPTAKSVSLAGMTVADKKGHSHKLTKDHGAVPAHGYKCLWFGHYDTKKYGSANYATQIDFKLDCDGGSISLLQGAKAVDAVTYPAAVSRCSWARTTDAADAWNFCAWPTPERTNDAATFAAMQLPAPVVSHAGGWIDGTTSFDVKVVLPDVASAAAPSGGEVAAALPDVRLFYTTDGRVPTLSSPSAAFDANGEAHFTVSQNTVYRFRAIASPADGEPSVAAANYLPSPVVTRSFITRSYTKTIVDDWGWGGWDGGWGGGWDGWGNTTEETTTFDGFSLLSIVTDPDYLYDNEKGIYVDGTNGGYSYWGYANYYQDWNRPVSVEIFSPEGLPLVRQEADMTMSGGYSRMSDPKSFKLKSDKKYVQDYGEGESANFFPVEAIIPEKPYARYKDVLVRVGGSDMLARHQDNALQTLARRSGLYVDCQAFRPVYVFFNGEYQETLLLREPSNKQFGYSNYGMDTDAMDTLEESDITAVSVASGSRGAFAELCEQARQCSLDDAAWQRVRELLDVDEYANYFALELYLANQDWPQNNIKMFREAKDATDATAVTTMCTLEPDGGRFHVVLQDLDACFHESGSTFDRIDQQEYYPYAAVGRQENVMLTLFFNLMRRDEFRQRFVDAFCLVAGSVFEPQVVETELERLKADLSVGYVEKRASLANAFGTLAGTLSSSWQQKRVDYLRRWNRAGVAYSPSITADISAQTSGVGLLLNGQPIPRSEFSGTLFLPVTLEARVPADKTFAGWSHNGKLVSTDPQLLLTSDGTYTALVTQKPEDDSNAERPAPVVVNEVSTANGIYQSSRFKRSDWVELYNATDAPYDICGLYISDDASQPQKHQLAESRVIPPHGHLVLWADDHELPFKLSNNDYSRVVITAPDGSWSNTLIYCSATAQQSVGRWPDGAAEVYLFDRPSIEAPNLFTSYAARLTYDPLIVGVRQEVVDEANKNADLKGQRYDMQGRRLRDASAVQRPVIAGGRKEIR